MNIKCVRVCLCVYVSLHFLNKSSLRYDAYASRVYRRQMLARSSVKIDVTW